MIAADDMQLIQLIDEPGEIVEAIFRHYEMRGFEARPKNANNCLIFNHPLLARGPPCAAFLLLFPCFRCWLLAALANVPPPPTIQESAAAQAEPEVRIIQKSGQKSKNTG